MKLLLSHCRMIKFTIYLKKSKLDKTILSAYQPIFFLILAYYYIFNHLLYIIFM